MSDVSEGAGGDVSHGGHITDSGHLATLGVGLQTSLEWTVLASEIHTVHRHSECGPPDFT